MIPRIAFPDPVVCLRSRDRTLILRRSPYSNGRARRITGEMDGEIKGNVAPETDIDTLPRAKAG